MEELEKYCLAEIEAVSEATFMYQLHECRFFNKIKFRQFISTASKLADYYENGKTRNYKGITSGIIDRFSYIMFMFYCHLAPDDLFAIENYQDIKDDIPEYFDDMRILTRKLITIINSKPAG